MGARIISLLAVLVIAVGCSKKEPETGMITADGDLTAADRAPITTMDTASSNVDGSVLPGSQQDLVVNVGDRVFFGYDQSDLTMEGRAAVERLAQWLGSYGNVALMVEGHADERGTREYNLALGEKRAMSVRNYLIALGVSPSRIQTISYGKERPAVVGSGDTSWAQNRRGVFVVQ
ncbi:MAG: peptidoglycan-associated lipoprotein Pal [Alphaproteobacteria bacterium]|nr:peptidoglycan-associated lipoprotein Pal [Alphaproteobacteria bacterium]